MAQRRNLLLMGLFALLILGTTACSRGEAKALGPDETVEHIAQELADGHPEVLWHALPKSYQQDVTDLVHDAAGKMDPELWNRSFGVLQKAALLLDEKREYIFGHPMVAGQMKDPKRTAKDWDAVVGLIRTVSDSELSNLDRVRTLDIEKFLGDTGAELMERLEEASELTSENPYSQSMAQMRKTDATIVTSTEDTATLSIKVPGRAASEERYTRVDDKWLPEELVQGWTESMAEMREQLAQYSPEQNPEKKQAALMQLTMIEAALDTMLQADSAAEFNMSVNAAMGMAMGAMMAQASSGGLETGPGDPSFGPDEPPMMAPAATAEPEAAPRRLDAYLDSKRAPERKVAVQQIEVEELPAGPCTLDQADKYMGTIIVVTGLDGSTTKGRLTSAEGGVLMLERHLGAGSFAVEIPESEISSLECVKR